MKNNVILFIIGVLVGAIISTGAFYIYTATTNNSNNNQNTQMPGDNPPSMPNGQNNENGQPPEMPNGQNNNVTQSTNQSSSN